MSASWKDLCRAAGLEREGHVLRVPCGNGRSHDVRVDDSLTGIVRLWSRVATRSQIFLERPEVEVWLINRYRELVGFKVSDRGTVIGEVWVPLIDVTPGEWSLYVHTLAKACDRQEHLWTGRDHR